MHITPHAMSQQVTHPSTCCLVTSHGYQWTCCQTERQWGSPDLERLCRKLGQGNDWSILNCARELRYYNQCSQATLLVWNLGKWGGPVKLRAYWEKTIYIVKEQVHDSPIYKVMSGRDGSKTCVLHWNLLHFVNDLPADLPPAATNTMTSTKGRGKKSSSIAVIKKQPDLAQRSDTNSASTDIGGGHHHLRVRDQNNQNSAE